MNNLKGFYGIVVLMLLSIMTLAKEHRVKMNDSTFFPDMLTVHEGDVVIWVNESDSVHTTTSGKDCMPDGMWSSKNISKGGEFKFIFQKSGSYAYFCKNSCTSGMVGTIYVMSSLSLEGGKGKKEKNWSHENNSTLSSSNVSSRKRIFSSVYGSHNPNPKIFKRKHHAISKIHTVKITNDKFIPEVLNIREGDVVKWINVSDTIQSSASGANCDKTQRWDSEDIEPGETYQHTFSLIGSYPYFSAAYCKEGIKGYINVGNRMVNWKQKKNKHDKSSEKMFRLTK